MGTWTGPKSHTPATKDGLFGLSSGETGLEELLWTPRGLEAICHPELELLNQGLSFQDVMAQDVMALG